MKNFNLDFLLGIAYIMFLTGICAVKIGQCTKIEMYYWYDPIYVFIAFSIPFVLGILSERNKRNDSK